MFGILPQEQPCGLVCLYGRRSRGGRHRSPSPTGSVSVEAKQIHTSKTGAGFIISQLYSLQPVDLGNANSATLDDVLGFR